MTVYAGLDVSLKQTHVCIVEGSGAVVWRGRSASRVEALVSVLRDRAPGLGRLGLETGSLSPYLVHGLREAGFEVVCLDARVAKQALKASPMKTDKNDAETLAQLVRIGFWRAVHVKSFETHRVRGLLKGRDKLVCLRRRLMSQMRGLLRPLGLVVGQVSAGRFAARIGELVSGDALMEAVTGALLGALEAITGELAKLDRLVRGLARRHPVCRRLMSVGGVGPITALAYVTAIDDPNRFRRARDVGPYLGLTPRKDQSGDVERDGSISKWGDGFARRCLYEAAGVLLGTVRDASALRNWGLRLRRKLGPKRARVALARKLAGILLRLWRDGTTFEAYPQQARG